MNRLEVALKEAFNTIAQLQARCCNLAIENAGLRSELEEKTKQISNTSNNQK